MPLAQRVIQIPDKRRATIALVVMSAAVGGAAFGPLPAAIAFASGELLFAVLKVIPVRRVYEAIDWPVIVLLGALMPVAGAMAATGAADWLAGFLLEYASREQPILGLTVIL